MTPMKSNEANISMPADHAKSYIVQMLEELSSIAGSSGLNELSSLLHATAGVTLEIKT
ncbi:hypothetical protein N9W89_10925 [Hellea sp.]|nr:hypothetical protein [Hellea sp.]